jgi:hypothetical protein
LEFLCNLLLLSVFVPDFWKEVGLAKKKKFILPVMQAKQISASPFLLDISFSKFSTFSQILSSCPVVHPLLSSYLGLHRKYRFIQQKLGSSINLKTSVRIKDN